MLRQKIPVLQTCKKCIISYFCVFQSRELLIFKKLFLLSLIFDIYKCGTIIIGSNLLRPNIDYGKTEYNLVNVYLHVTVAKLSELIQIKAYEHLPLRPDHGPMRHGAFPFCFVKEISSSCLLRHIPSFLGSNPHDLLPHDPLGRL